MSVASPVIDHLDLATKHIYLLAGTREYHPVDDIYKEIRNLRRTDESLRVFDQPVGAEGAVPKGGGKSTPRYAVFKHGWTVVPEDVEHVLYISGEQITDDEQAGPACMDVSGLASKVIIHYEPPSAEIIIVTTDLSSLTLDISEILKLTGNKVVKAGDIITIYEDDESTPWRSYDLASGGRVEL